MRNPYVSKASRGNVRRGRMALCRVHYVARSGSFEVSRACEMTEDRRVTMRADIAPLRPVSDWAEFKRAEMARVRDKAEAIKHRR